MTEQTRSTIQSTNQALNILLNAHNAEAKLNDTLRHFRSEAFGYWGEFVPRPEEKLDTVRQTVLAAQKAVEDACQAKNALFEVFETAAGGGEDNTVSGLAAAVTATEVAEGFLEKIEGFDLEAIDEQQNRFDIGASTDEQNQQ